MCITNNKACHNAQLANSTSADCLCVGFFVNYNHQSEMKCVGGVGTHQREHSVITVVDGRDQAWERETAFTPGENETSRVTLQINVYMSRTQISRC